VCAALRGLRYVHAQQRLHRAACCDARFFDTQLNSLVDRKYFTKTK